ncbi:MAG: esterase/lipase [Rickettsiales bacterium]|jgi:esterase/lipase
MFKKIYLTIILSLIVFSSAKLEVLAKTPDRFIKTNISSDLYDISQYESLDQYTKNYRKYINQYRPHISKIEIERIAPFSIDSGNNCSKKDGFVLIHGLSDSPFSMFDIANSIAKNNACTIINVPILPGHTLIPGASLEATNEDWISTVKFAVDDLKSRKANSITIAGFSTGGALALNYVLSNYSQAKNMKLILLSPSLDLDLPWYEVLALKIMTLIGNIKNSFAYLKKFDDSSPYRYESFSFKGTNELYELTKKNEAFIKKIGLIKNPTFIAASTADSTIDIYETLAFLEKNFTNIRGIIYDNNNIFANNGLIVERSQNLSQKIIDLSHISIPFSFKNPIFGKYAKINYGCLHYEKNNLEKFYECRKFNSDFYYGETNSENKKKYPKISRITYNPQYEELEVMVLDFIKNR